MSQLGRNSTEVQWLPTEIYQAILRQLDPLSPQDTLTLLRCAETNAHLRSIATDPLIWKPYYEHRWTRSEPAKELQRLRDHQDDWFRLVSIRGSLDKQASRMFQLLLESSRAEQHRYATGLVRSLGNDVWNFLKRVGHVRSARENEEENWLNRAYWARELTDVMERRHAIDVCRRIADSEPVSLEEGLSVLSAFCGADYPSVSNYVVILTYDMLI
jgi:hypothetical protein